MRRYLVLVAVPLFLAACSGSGTDPSSSPAPTEPAASAPATGAADASSAAEGYCRSVDEYIAAAKKALKKPLAADTKDLTTQLQELQQQAESLAGDLMADPDAITRVQSCTEKLQEFNSEG